jgi:hypothetical protein
MRTQLIDRRYAAMARYHVFAATLIGDDPALLAGDHPAPLRGHVITPA